MTVTKSRKTATQQRWTTPERKLVMQRFGDHIEKGELPKKKECEEFIKNNVQVMGKRSWTNVKDFVRNVEQKMSKRL